MAEFLNIPFHSMSNDDLFELFRHTSESDLADGVPVTHATPYDKFTADNLNSSADEFTYDFGDDSIQKPLCNYITVNECKEVYHSFSKDTFSLLHLNIRSLNKHFDELQFLLESDQTQSCSVIGLSETWLTASSENSFAIDGYNMYVNNRPDRCGGGVAFYVSSSFKCVVHSDICRMDSTVESLFIELSIPGCKNVVVGIMYRPPNSNVVDFLTYISDLAKNPVFRNKDCFLLGDYNIDLLKSGNDHSTNEFLETLLSSSFLPLISKPTRVTDHSATLIDNMFCNVLPLPDSFIILSDITDHFPVMTYFTLKTFVNDSKLSFPLFKRRVSPEKLASLDAALDNADWSRVYESDDVNLSFDNFMNIFNAFLDDIIPKQKKNMDYKKTPRLPRISKSILPSINRKHCLYYKYKMENTEQSKGKKYINQNFTFREEKILFTTIV